MHVRIFLLIRCKFSISETKNSFLFLMYAQVFNKFEDK